MDKRIRVALPLALTALLLLAAIVGCKQAQPVPLGTTHMGALSLSETLTVAGASTLTGAISSGGALTVAGNVLIDGQADEVQLTVQSSSPQNVKTLVVEMADGTDLWTVNNAGSTTIELATDTYGLKIRGTEGQAAAPLAVFEAYDGTDFFTVGPLGIVKVGTILKLVPGVAQTIVNGTKGITPTNTYHRLTAAGTVGNTMAVAGYSAGDYVILVNTVAQNIVISDTGNTKLTGDITLNQYDTLELIYNGANWIMLSTANN